MFQPRDPSSPQVHPLLTCPPAEFKPQGAFRIPQLQCSTAPAQVTLAARGGSLGTEGLARNNCKLLLLLGARL